MTDSVDIWLVGACLSCAGGLVLFVAAGLAGFAWAPLCLVAVPIAGFGLSFIASTIWFHLVDRKRT